MGDTRRDTPLARKDARLVGDDAPASEGRIPPGQKDVRPSGIEVRHDDRRVIRLLLVAGAAVLVFAVALLLWMLQKK